MLAWFSVWLLEQKDYYIYSDFFFWDSWCSWSIWNPRVQESLWACLMFKTGMFAKLLQPGQSWALTNTISHSPVHSTKHLVSLPQHFWVLSQKRPTLSAHKYTEMCLCLTSVRGKLLSLSLGSQTTECSVASASRATFSRWKAAACCTAHDGPCELSVLSWSTQMAR